MAEAFNWIRPGYEIIKNRFEWKVQVPFFTTAEEDFQRKYSSFFSSPGTPESKWKLGLGDKSENISIFVWHYNSEENNSTYILEQVLVKISIINGKGQTVMQRILPSKANSKFVKFTIAKQDIINSKCQQANGNLSFCCKIFSHVRKQSVSSDDTPGIAVDCNGQLIAHFEGLFDSMKFSDVIFNIDTRQFPAHKSILAARSKVFAAMFQHPTKENLTNTIKIEDIEPKVFQELLRFIYTGRLSITTMEVLAVGLLVAADKYWLEDLERECKEYLIDYMSPVNCVDILLRGNLLNPPEYLKNVYKEAGNFFRRLPSEVMATTKWEQMEEEDPKLLFSIQKILLSKKVY